MEIGQFIKEERLKKGMTQEDLAAKTDISARTIQRIENAEVDARAYTLKNIATALEVDFKTLNSFNSPALPDQENDNINTWLPLLHLSGLFNLLLPPLIIWLIKKDKVKNIREHGIFVLNFQLSMLLYQLVCGLFAFFIPPPLVFTPALILVCLILFSIGAVLVNTLKVFNGQAYKYPFSINILKAKI